LNALIVDTGFLVAFGRRSDPLHAAASTFLRGFAGRLITVTPVIVETCFFFDPQGKVRLLDWVGSGAIAVVDAGVDAYPDLARNITRYSNRDIDLADAALVWLADRTGIRSILTVDDKDFAIYRLSDRRRFDLVAWM
jgi:uncharacterized protein